MKNKPILIVPGDPESIFFEIFFKSLKKNKFKSPLILVASNKLLVSQMKKFNFSKKVNLIKIEELKDGKINNNSINIINVNYISRNSNIYLKKCFEIAFDLIRNGYTKKFINGPINKSNYLNKKYPGVTEYISKKFNKDKVAMLIYNKEISVCPLTTHLPLKLVPKKISKNLIKEKAILINDFYKKVLGFKPKIAVTGLNPHCESILKFNEDRKIIAPVIKLLKQKGFKIDGPFSADTIFLKQNRIKFDVIVGMYHDQVLTPIKTIKEYDAINITLGLPFLRISPDHGPNKEMINKNLSNPLSLINAIKFLDTK
tara:strand:- start:1014 stop:1955 length:942 start_codon:yes stop_codon:yes gene_type:complete